MKSLARRCRRLSISPAVVISIIALVAAVGGSAVAAQRATAPTKITACITRAGVYVKSRSNGTCASGQTKQSWSIRGPQGLRGLPGAAGTSGTNGTNGTNGSQGPAGASAQFAIASLGGTVSTSSGTPVDLGGPSVTVTTGSSGLIEVMARGTLATQTPGTAHASVAIDGVVAIAVGCETPGSYILMKTNGVGSTNTRVSPGTACESSADGPIGAQYFQAAPNSTHAVSLRYDATSTADFTNIALWAVPR